MELFHTSTSASSPTFNSLYSSNTGIFDLFQQEANLSSSLDLLAASVESTLAENGTFATASTNAPGQFSSLTCNFSTLFSESTKADKNSTQLKPQLDPVPPFSYK